ncbi:MAG TPA: TIM-barrel domain-containing protein [Acidimicrobiales bacterium]|nr:TIM-barrel domain-containing protein [Acidimicrobiales bacterium]
MIRHRPLGRGHAYLVEPDQVVPSRPIAGTPYELRATTKDDVSELQVELSLRGTRSVIEACSLGPAVPAIDPLYGVPAERVVEEGHLSDAVARLGAQEGRLSWAVRGPELVPNERLRYRFVGGRDRTRWFGLEACHWAPAGGSLTVDADSTSLARRVVTDALRWLVGGTQTYRCRFALDLGPGEHVVGFGERFNGVDQRGKRVDIAVFDQYKGQGGRSYMPVPFAFVVGAEPFALHLVTGRRSRFDIGASRRDQLLVEVDFEPGEVDPELTLVLFAGPPKVTLPRFLERTGTLRTPPPDWAYRLWMSSNEWDSQDRVVAEVKRSEREGIFPGVVVIEAWSDESTFVAFNDALYEPHADGSPHRLADFSFPGKGRWPDPKAMVDDLHARDIRVLLWQIPLVYSRKGQAGFDRKAMEDRHYCVFRRDGKPYRNRGWWFPGALLCDFTNPEARDWWTAKRRYLLDEVGVDGFKTDGGEHAWGSDLVYADGTTGGESNNLYPVHYGAAYHELMRASGRHPVTFSRAGFTGSSAIPCHWAGDEDSTWEAFRASISAGLTASACGITFWGWDFAGFSGDVPTTELYLRAAAMAVFCPIMQYHSEYNHHRTPCRDRTPWNVAARNDDSRLLPAFRRFVQLRERLVPYLSEQGRLAVQRRLPLMRALFLETDDERIWEFADEYMLGDDILVAPITAEGALDRRVYVPAGEWVDPWSDDRFTGPVITERSAPLDEIPVLVRAERAAVLVGHFKRLGSMPEGVSQLL